MKRAIVIEGGALRGVHTSGVLDTLMKYDIFFPYVIGVSAGALNAFNYVSRQPGRSARVNLQYIRDDRYFNLRNIPKQDESAFNFDFMFNGITAEIPFDFDTFYDPSQEFLIVATDVADGKPLYFKKSSCENIFRAGAASASLPFISPPVELEGHRCIDGGVADPIPVMKALEDGNDKVVVVLTRHKGFRKRPMPKAEREAAKRLYKDSPEMLKTALRNNEFYNETLDLIDRLEEEGRIFVIRPSAEIDISFLERDPEDLGELYREGLRDGESAIRELCEYLEIPDSEIMSVTRKAGKINVGNYISHQTALKQLGDLMNDGPRLTGNDAHRKLTNSIAHEIKKSGLQPYTDPYFFERRQQKRCEFRLMLPSGEVTFNAVPLPNSGYTEEAVTAPLSFLDDNKSYKFLNSRGKIAVMSFDDDDIQSGILKNTVCSKNASVEKSFGKTENTSFGFLKLAKISGVKGLVCIWNGKNERIFKSTVPPVFSETDIPAVWISKEDGERLAALRALRQSAEASLFVQAEKEENETAETVYCMIKGEEAGESVIIGTHTDGTNFLDENGFAAVLALIRCLKEKKLRRTHIFVFASGRLILPVPRTPTASEGGAIEKWLLSHPDLWDGKNGHMKAVAAVTFEHMGLPEDIVFSSNTATDEAYLRAVADSEDARYTLIRSGNTVFGEGQPLNAEGIPTVAFNGDCISGDFSIDRMTEQIQTALDCLMFFEDIPKEAIGRSEKPSILSAVVSDIRSEGKNDRNGKKNREQ